jgi:hypothetical protein
MGKDINIQSILDNFRNKCAVWQTQPAAERLLKQLKELLTEDDWWKLRIAHNHYLTNEGPDELYDVCKELSKKYINVK